MPTHPRPPRNRYRRCPCLQEALADGKSSLLLLSRSSVSRRNDVLTPFLLVASRLVFFFRPESPIATPSLREAPPPPVTSSRLPSSPYVFFPLSTSSGSRLISRPSPDPSLPFSSLTDRQVLPAPHSRSLEGHRPRKGALHPLPQLSSSPRTDSPFPFRSVSRPLTTSSPLTSSPRPPRPSTRVLRQHLLSFALFPPLARLCFGP